MCDNVPRTKRGTSLWHAQQRSPSRNFAAVTAARMLAERNCSDCGSLMGLYLMEIIESEDNIKLAYRTIKKNTGSDTSEVDKRTIADLAKLSEEEYVRLIRKQFSIYHLRPVRRVEIPKPKRP